MVYTKIQYISQGKTNAEHLLNIREVLDAGCTWIQLRIKEFNQLMNIAEEVKKNCVEYNSILIVNDFIEVAKQIDADGVHLGLGDESVEKAREFLGDNKIIGGTANTLEDVNQRIKEKCNYIGLGPFRSTTTKSNLSPILGIEGYQNINSSLSDLKIPIYAIGGIELTDIKLLLQTKVYGVALSGSITKESNKKEFIKKIIQELNG